MPEPKTPGDPSLPDYTPVTINEDELDLLKQLLELECLWQVTSIFSKGVTGSVDDKSLAVAKIFQTFEGYRRADDLLLATKEAYFKTNPGYTFDIYFEIEFLRVFKNCIIYTPNDVKLPAGTMDKYRKYASSLLSKINLSMMSFKQEPAPQKTQKLDDSAPGMMQNIFSGKASA